MLGRRIRFSGRFGGKLFCLVCGFLLSCTLALFLAGSVFAVLFSQSAHAQSRDELITVVSEGTAQAESAVAAADMIQSKLIADAAREKVIEVIGEQRYQKNKNLVEKRLVSQSAKFIPFVNPGKPVQQAGGQWSMQVELKISTASLRKMVLESGLLSDAEGPVSILPLVAFTNRTKGDSSRWWLGEDRNEATQFLHQMSRSFHDVFQREFSKQGFHMIKPTGSQASPIPAPFRAQRPSTSDLDLMANYFKASMVLKGDVRFRPSRAVAGAVLCTVKLQVIQPATSRVVAEVTRAFESDSGNFEAVSRAKFQAELPEVANDLSIQVLDAWQRGTLNANLVRLAVRGRLSPQQLETFKTSLSRSVHEVKSMKERLFENGLVQFEVDYTGDVEHLKNKLKNLQMPAFQTSFAGVNSSRSEESLVLDVKVR